MSAERPGSLRAVALLAVAGSGLVAFAYLTPPSAGSRLAASLPGIGALPGDLPAYAWRFLLSFLLLGALPLAAALALGERPAGLGLCRPRPLSRRWVFPLLLGVVVLASLAGAYYAPVYGYYPYSRTLTESRPGGAAGFLLHAVLYLALYYVPWELLFRGILVFPLLRLLVSAAGRRGAAGRAGSSPPGLLAVACLQALPSTLLHFGHPWSETLSALPFGLAAGWLALTTGSILPGLALHAAAGLFLDLFILLRRAGGLP
jgi:membrane protease YdiL (CAAX protease family)